MTELLAVHAAATLFMGGLIWFVQLVHYPLFAHVGAERFAAYEAAHTARTSIVVVPPMLVELVSAVALLWWRPLAVAASEAAVGLGLVGIIWGSTFFLQVPAHQALARGFDPGVARRLVATNWIRTLAWSARAGLCAVWIGRSM